ncbi:MAG: alginate export family protein [Bacteroidales bacterium]|jgi:hypothetical protein|nr:alginate export family protein [Bacteroidales bacterium]
MKKRIISIAALSLLTVAQVAAQNVKIDGEIRSRAEVRDGFQEPLADSLSPAFVNNLRTRLNFGYTNEKVKAKVSLLDSRTFGKTAIAETGAGVGVLEAWGEYNFTPAFSFALGRQGLEYDDKRVFSYNNWSNTPGAHDLLLLKYNAETWQVHAGSAYNNAGDVNFEALTPYTLTYKTLNFIRAEKNFGKLSVSALWLNDSYQSGSATVQTVNNVTTSFRNTVGGNVWITDKKAPFTFLASGYYQFGHDKTDKELSAYLLSLTAQQKVGEIVAFQLGGDLYSGSALDIAADKSNTFNKLYGSNHAFNGNIEYWRNLPNQGLIDGYVGATAKLFPKFDINATFHYFATQKEFKAGEKKSIGSELDLVANYTVSDQFSLQGGWSAYFVNDGTRILKKKVDVDTHFPQWAYLQLTFKPTFLNSKN